MGATVLLVEDEVLISEPVRDALSDEGFAVHVAHTADAALEYLEREGEVDVLFTDINLPGEINGAELASRARAMRPDLPVVYASGRLASSDLGGLVSRSVFLPKPYNLREVCNLLRRLTPITH